MRLKLSLLGLAAIGLLAAGTAVATPAPDGRFVPRSPSLSSSVQTRTARLAPGLARQALRAQTRQRDADQPLNHQLNNPGDLDCESNFIGIRPVDASGHTVTVTWSFMFVATQPDLSDASSDLIDTFLAQFGAQYFFVDPGAPNPFNGPFSWADAGIGVGIERGHFVAVVNVAFYIDGSTITGTDAFVLQTFGPNAFSPTICQL